MLRCDAGLLGLATDGRAGRRAWLRRALALITGAALALSVSAVTATSASAWGPTEFCTIFVNNNTPYPMQLYGAEVTGERMSPFASTISAMDLGRYDAVAYWPLKSYCSIHLWLRLQTSDGSGWSESVEIKVNDDTYGPYRPKAIISGDFEARASLSLVLPPYIGDVRDGELAVAVNPIATGASGGSTARLRAGADPLRRASDATRRLREPKQVRSLLRRGDLIGRGWRRATRVGDLGRLGSILAAAKVPASCRDNKNSMPSPLKEGLSAFPGAVARSSSARGRAFTPTPGNRGRRSTTPYRLTALAAWRGC